MFEENNNVVDIGGDAHSRREAARDFLQGGSEESAEEEQVVEAVETEEEQQEEEQQEEEEKEEQEESSEETDEEHEEGEESEEHEEEQEESSDDAIDSEELESLRDRSEAFEGLIEALDATDYPVDFTDLAKGMEEVGMRLADSHAMYDLVNGKGADGIFQRILKFQGQQVHDFALGEVLKYAQKIGLVDGPEGEEGDVNDPVALENQRLKAKIAAMEKGTVENNVQSRQMTVFNSAVAELKRVATDRKIDEQDIEDFLIPAMAKGVGGNKAVINRIARGNFVDLHKIIDETINRLVGKRVVTTNNKVANRKTRDVKITKRVAGGHTPSAASNRNTKVDLSDPEQRRSAAKAALRA